MAPRLSSDLERYPAPDAFERKPHGRSGTLRPNFSRRRLRPIGSQRRSPGRLGGHGDVGVDTRNAAGRDYQLIPVKTGFRYTAYDKTR